MTPAVSLVIFLVTCAFITILFTPASQRRSTMSNPTITTKPSLMQRIKSHRGAILLAAATGLVGLFVGVASTQSGEPQAAPAPEPEVVTETVEVEVADPTCRDAAEGLHILLQQQVAITSELSTAAADAMNGAASFDTAAVEAATADVNALSARQEQQTTTYTTEVAPLLDECRAG